MIEWVEIDKLIPNPKNPNKHSAEQIDRLVGIIKYQGWRHPIIVDKDYLIWAGHGRLLAAKKLKLEKVPIHIQEFQSEEQAYAFLVSDNAIASWAELDLAFINNELPLLGPDFDIDLLGIKDFEIEPADKYGDKDADAVPDVKTETSIRMGDLFSLGSHRLLCGDSTDRVQVERLMNGEKADMVFTDPPYNLASDSTMIVKTELRGNSYGKLADSEWDKNFDPKQFLECLNTVCGERVSIYITTSDHLFGQMFGWLKQNTDYAHYCVWAKPNPMPSLTKKHWTWSTELIAYGARKGHVFNHPIEGNALSVWSLPKSVKNDLHPTQKPVHIPSHAILHSSNTGQLVIDLFLGSGSTLIACEKTNRRCFGMEIDPHYCDVIIARWEQFTGQKAVKLGQA